jgi:SAM-dependent methyltransferase
MSDGSAEYFDQWYVNMADRGQHDDIVQRHLGLPPHPLSTSLLTWDGIAEVVDALRLAPGARLLDLACGRGGYGLEIAARTRAQLVGVDFSAEAIRQATQNAQRSYASAEFRVGELAATGAFGLVRWGCLCRRDPVQCAAGVLRRDATRSRPPWTSRTHDVGSTRPDDERVPERIRAVDTEGGLAAAGFRDVDIRERPQWRVAERAMWEEAAAPDSADDPTSSHFTTKVCGF